MRRRVVLVAVAFDLALAACGSHRASDAIGAGDGGADGLASTPPPPPSPPTAPPTTDGGADASPCPSGSTLLRDRTSCPGAPLAPPAALASALGSATAGDVVTMSGMDEGAAPCLPVVTCTPEDAPSLLFSDDPESPAADGVLYADAPPAGRHRIYVYHANGGTAPRKFPVVVLNQGATAATITIRRRGVGGPSKAYVAVGKDVLASWLAPMAPIVVNVPPGQRVLLDSEIDGKHATKDDLVHAIYDVETSAPLKISIVSVGASDDAAAVAAGLSLLARDGLHVRGTFANADVIVTAPKAAQKSGVQRLRLGLNEVDDDLEGVDAPVGTKVKLAGNYGLLYRFELGLAAPVAAALAPRGGAWGGVLASSAAVVRLPSATEALGSTTDAIALGDLGATSIALATGGGSNLPVDVFLVTP
jgi:hypothetical protein